MYGKCALNLRTCRVRASCVAWRRADLLRREAFCAERLDKDPAHLLGEDGGQLLNRHAVEEEVVGELLHPRFPSLDR